MGHKKTMWTSWHEILCLWQESLQSHFELINYYEVRHQYTFLEYNDQVTKVRKARIHKINATVNLTFIGQCSNDDLQLGGSAGQRYSGRQTILGQTFS